jgi:hypothetical protein
LDELRVAQVVLLPKMISPERLASPLGHRFGIACGGASPVRRAAGGTCGTEAWWWAFLPAAAGPKSALLAIGAS